MKYAVMAHNGQSWDFLVIGNRIAVYDCEYTARGIMCRIGRKYPNIDMAVVPFES